MDAILIRCEKLCLVLMCNPVTRRKTGPECRNKREQRQQVNLVYQYGRHFELEETKDIIQGMSFTELSDVVMST